jgi:hypothetical protein
MMIQGRGTRRAICPSTNRSPRRAPLPWNPGKPPKNARKPRCRAGGSTSPPFTVQGKTPDDLQDVSEGFEPKAQVRTAAQDVFDEADWTA